MILPLSRSKNIVVQNVDEELLVYDLGTNKAFCLNETTKTVFNACDGKTTINELIAQNKNLNDGIVRLALEKLSSQNLLEGKIESNISRRQLLARAAAASAALPVLTIIVAPTAVHAQSCLAGNAPCNLNDPGACCSLTCLGNGGNPICLGVCLADGNSCSLNDPAVCCSKVCINNGGNPICSSGCVTSGNPCNLNDPGACCSQTCLANGGNPVCL
jgi:hypothetical protein